MSDYTYNKMPKDPKLCQLIRKTITVNRKAIGLEFKDVAAELGMQLGTLENKLKPSYDNGDMTITEFMHFLELTGDMSALEYIASKFEMVLVHKHTSHSEISNINILVDAANIENGDVFRVIKCALLDGVITKIERQMILKEIDEADRANAELRDIIINLNPKE